MTVPPRLRRTGSTTTWRRGAATLAMALAMAMAVVLSGVAVTGVAPAQAATSTGSVVEQELRVTVRAESDGSAVTLEVTR